MLHLSFTFVTFNILQHYQRLTAMAGAEFSIGTLCLIVLLAYGTLQCVQGADSIPGLGINWGALASHPMDPNIVANMLRDSGIKKVKLFDADPWIVGAFSGDFEVMVGIPNDQLSKFAGSLGDSEDWVKENLTKHLHNGGVNIRFVSVRACHYVPIHYTS